VKYLIKSNGDKVEITHEGGKRYRVKKESERKTPPKGYPKNQKEYAIPEELKYPIDTYDHIKAAMTYFSQYENNYDSEKRKTIWRKIVSAAKKQGIEVSKEIKEKTK
jgi:hypothetical protein